MTYRELLAGAAAEQAENAGPKPTVVLMHGGFADASGWEAVIRKLQDDGYPVMVTANPRGGYSRFRLSGEPARYIEWTSGSGRRTGRRDCHLNAAVMTHNAQNDQALVFVAAFIPDVGERGADLTPEPGSLVGPAP